MPVITTIGSISASNFGFSRKKKLIREYLSTSSTSWTCPIGVTNIEINVQGSPGVGPKWYKTFERLVCDFAVSNTAPSQTSANTALQTWLNDWASTINSGATGERTITAPSNTQYSTTYSLDNGTTTLNFNLGNLFYLTTGAGSTTTIRGSVPSTLPGNATIRYNNPPNQLIFDFTRANPYGGNPGEVSFGNTQIEYSIDFLDPLKNGSSSTFDTTQISGTSIIGSGGIASNTLSTVYADISREYYYPSYTNQTRNVIPGTTYYYNIGGTSVPYDSPSTVYGSIYIDYYTY